MGDDDIHALGEPTKGPDGEIPAMAPKKPSRARKVGKASVDPVKTRVRGLNAEKKQKLIDEIEARNFRP